MESPSSVQDGISDRVNIQFLYFASCPNAQAALAFLRETLLADGVTSEVELIAMETEEAARQFNFVGSPTIRVNDEDVSPPTHPSAPSLACRLYRDAAGRPSPHPPRDALISAIHRAGHHNRKEAN